MNAKISSIYLTECNNGVYWKITLIDEMGNVLGIFADYVHCDDINFRKQTFYLMKILNNWDLLNLDGQDKSFPILTDSEFGILNCIANDNGDYLKIDYKTGEILSGSDCDKSELYSYNVSSLRSCSGVLMASVTDRYSHRGFMGSKVYLGFTPIYPYQENKELEICGARCFREFVCGLLKLCNLKELIQSNNYPQVLIKYDSNGNIIAIGDIDGNEYLHITSNGYEFVNEKSKTRHNI